MKKFLTTCMCVSLFSACSRDVGADLETMAFENQVQTRSETTKNISFDCTLKNEVGGYRLFQMGMDCIIFRGENEDTEVKNQHGGIGGSATCDRLYSDDLNQLFNKEITFGNDIVNTIELVNFYIEEVDFYYIDYDITIAVFGDDEELLKTYQGSISDAEYATISIDMTGIEAQDTYHIDMFIIAGSEGHVIESYLKSTNKTFQYVIRNIEFFGENSTDIYSCANWLGGFFYFDGTFSSYPKRAIEQIGIFPFDKTTGVRINFDELYATYGTVSQRIRYEIEVRGNFGDEVLGYSTGVFTTSPPYRTSIYGDINDHEPQYEYTVNVVLTEL